MKNLKYTKLALIIFAASLFSFVAVNNVLIAMDGELNEAFGDMDPEALQEEFNNAAEQTAAEADKVQEQINNFNENVNQDIQNVQKGLGAAPTPKPADVVSLESSGFSSNLGDTGNNAVTQKPPTSASGATEGAVLTQGQTPPQIEDINNSSVEAVKPKATPVSDVHDALEARTTAQGELSQAKADLATAKASGDPAKIASAQKAYETANANFKDAAGQVKSMMDSNHLGSHYEQTSEWADSAKKELTSAQADKVAADKALSDKFPNGEPKRSDYSDGNAGNEAYAKDLAAYKNSDEYKASTNANNAVEKAQGKYDAAQTASKQEFARAANEWLVKDVFKFAGEQLVQSILFSVVPEIFQYMTQHAQNEALYSDITAMKTFGGINMCIPSGLIPSQNPAGGAFIYYDVQPEAVISDAYLRSPDRRWFVSYDPTGYAAPAAFYIGASSFPDSMLELTTGLIFDASGGIIAPGYQSSSPAPFTFPTSLMLDDTSTFEGSSSSAGIGGTPLWSSTPKLSIQAALNGFTTNVAGDSSSTSYGEMDPVNALLGGTSSYATGPSANPNVEYLFTTQSGSPYPPIMHSALQQYVTPTGNALTGFGQPATDSTPAVSMSLQELAGLGNLASVFGPNYFNLFVSQQPGQPGSQSATNATKLNSFYQGIEALTYTHPTGVTDPNVQLVGTTLELANATTLNNLLATIGADTIQGINGFDPRDHLLAHGLPIYQTDSTPTAQFLKNFVTATSSSVLAKYVHDIVVPLDGNKLPTAATVPTINNGIITYQENPAIQYITSLVSGLTYSQNNGYSLPVQAATGGPDNSIALGILSYISPATAKWTVSTLVYQQISQIRELFNNAITEGPFNLNGGLQAYRVTLPAMLNAVVDGVTNQSLVDNWIGNIAEGIPNSASYPDFNQKMALLADAFVYIIPNALQGIASDGKTVISIPDYVVPIMQDLTNVNCYLMAPLGCQASAQSTGFGMPSQQIFGLISLVTSKFYSSNYILKNNSVTDAFKIGNPPTLQTVLGTAFIETDFNPLNFTNTGTQDNPVYTPIDPYVITIPPLYFLALNAFSFSFGLLPVASTSTEAGTSAAGATFVIPGGGKPTPLGIPLNALFPEGFTGLAANSVPLNGPIPGSSTPAAQTTYTNDELVSIENAGNGALPSISAVHASWATYMNSITPGSINLELDPQYICNNNGVSDWTITPTNITDVRNGNFFYATNQTNGFYVLATYGNGGTVATANISGKSVSLSSFSNIGANFSEASSSNALIDVGTGAVLVIVPGANSSTTTMAPLMRYSLVNGTNPAAPLAPILLDPQAVVAAALKTQQANNENKAPTAQLLARIASAQGNVTNTAVMGPYSYAGYSLTIDRQLYNDGNYIYTAKDATGTIVDYLITHDYNATQVYDKIFDNGEMASMLNGRLFSSSGVNNNANGGIFYGVNNFDLSDAPATCEGYVVGVSGNPIVSLTEPTILADIAALATATNDPVIQQTKIIDNSASISAQALAIAQQLPISSSTLTLLNSAQPVPSTIGQFTQFDAEEGIIIGQLVQDSNQQFYLRSAVPPTSSTPNNTTNYAYYQFDISQLSAIPALDKNKILSFPTGVYYDETGVAQSVLVGPAAVKMLSAYGLVATSTNQLTLGLPMVRPSLPMTVFDYDVTNYSSPLLNGGNGVLMQRLPGTSSINGPTANYYFYKNIFHAGASLAQLQAAENQNSPTLTNPNYATYNDPYSPYDLLLQVNPIAQQGSSIPAGTPYFVSLITGIAYNLDGTQMYENVELYFQNIGGSSAPASNMPLVVWGDGIADTQAILGSSNESVGGGQKIEGTTMANFNTYQVDSLGWSFEYVSTTDTSNNPVIYTLTYQDPSYYLSSGNPGYSFQVYPSTAVPNSDGEYISQIKDSIGNITYVIENSDGKNTPLIPGQIFKVYSNGSSALPFGDPTDLTAFPPLTSSSSQAAIAANNASVLNAIANTISYNMGQALTSGTSANNPLPTLGTVYKMSTGTPPAVIKGYYNNTDASGNLIFDTSSFGYGTVENGCGDIDVSIDGTFGITIINPGYISLVLANMKAAQAANPTTGTVFVVPSVTAALLPPPLKSSYSTSLTPPAGATALTPSQIQSAAGLNMVNALNDANSAKLAQSRKLMNMTNVVTYGSTLQKILLAQDSLGVYSLYQSNLLTNNGAALGTYVSEPSVLWKANVLNFVGTRSSTALVGTLPTYDQTNFANNTVLIENVLGADGTGKNPTYDVIIVDNSVYMPVKPGGDLGVGLTALNPLGTTKNPSTEPTAVTYAPLGFDTGSTNPTSGLSTDSGTYITLSIKNYGDLLNPGQAPVTQITNANGELVDIWPETASALLLNDAKYVSIVAPFNSTGDTASTEWIFQYVYPLVDPNAIPDLLGSLNVALVGSTSGVITPVMALPVTNGAIALNSITVSPSDAQTLQQNVASSLITTAYDTAEGTIITAQQSLTALISEVNSDAAQTSSIARVPLAPGSTCGAGLVEISMINARHQSVNYCLPANALSLVGNNAGVTNAINAAQTETVAQLQQGVDNATTALANLKTNFTAVTTPTTGPLATRAANRIAFLQNLYYRTVNAVNENGSGPSVAILYYKVDANTMNLFSPTTNATLGCYIEYPIGTQEAGYIYNGIAPTAAQLDSTGTPIPPALALGAPTGASLSSADMTALTNAVGTIALTTEMPTLIPDRTQNSIIVLNAGNSAFNNYFYFGDLLPGGSAFIVPPAPAAAGASSSSLGAPKKSTVKRARLKSVK